MYTVVTFTSGPVRERWRVKAVKKIVYSEVQNDGEKSVRENHQPGIEYDGEKDMASCYDGERPNDGPGGSRDLPSQRKKAAREDSYHPKREEADEE
jgi:hypothetical protein